ncbi:MAG: BON domain-containing protein [Pyrinomonadaceae bacterium]
MNNKLTGLLIGTALSAFAFSACQTTSNTNTNRVVMTNSNTAVVVNNNGNTSVTTTRTNTSVTKEDYEKNKTDYEKQAKDTGSKIGQGANDMWLWTKTRAELLATSDLRESTINVDVNDDVVTLRGTVANAEQKTKAYDVAKSIEGVKSVTNDLQIKSNDSATNQMVNGTANMHSNSNMKK